MIEIITAESQRLLMNDKVANSSCTSAGRVHFWMTGALQDRHAGQFPS